MDKWRLVVVTRSGDKFYGEPQLTSTSAEVYRKNLVNGCAGSTFTTLDGLDHKICNFERVSIRTDSIEQIYVERLPLGIYPPRKV